MNEPTKYNVQEVINNLQVLLDHDEDMEFRMPFSHVNTDLLTGRKPPTRRKDCGCLATGYFTAKVLDQMDIEEEDEVMERLGSTEHMELAKKLENHQCDKAFWLGVWMFCKDMGFDSAGDFQQWLEDNPDTWMDHNWFEPNGNMKHSSKQYKEVSVPGSAFSCTNKMFFNQADYEEKKEMGHWDEISVKAVIQFLEKVRDRLPE